MLLITGLSFIIKNLPKLCFHGGPINFLSNRVGTSTEAVIHRTKQIFPGILEKINSSYTKLGLKEKQNRIEKTLETMSSDEEITNEYYKKKKKKYIPPTV